MGYFDLIHLKFNLKYMNNTSLTKRKTQLLYPKLNEVEGGYPGFTLSVCLYVCP